MNTVKESIYEHALRRIAQAAPPNFRGVTMSLDDFKEYQRIASDALADGRYDDLCKAIQARQRAANRPVWLRWRGEAIDSFLLVRRIEHEILGAQFHDKRTGRDRARFVYVGGYISLSRRSDASSEWCVCNQREVPARLIKYATRFV